MMEHCRSCHLACQHCSQFGQTLKTILDVKQLESIAKKQFGEGRENLSRFSGVQPTLLLPKYAFYLEMWHSYGEIN